MPWLGDARGTRACSAAGHSRPAARSPRARPCRSPLGSPSAVAALPAPAHGEEVLARAARSWARAQDRVGRVGRVWGRGRRLRWTELGPRADRSADHVGAGRDLSVGPGAGLAEPPTPAC